MGRIDLWERRLNEVFDEAQKAPFIWGEFDCCLFACRAIHALTGYDPGELYRGRYGNEEEARVLLKQEGGVEGIAEKITALKGFAEIGKLFAQRGDIGLAEIRGHQSLGVCDGARFAFASDPAGLLYIAPKSSLITKAWKIA